MVLHHSPFVVLCARLSIVEVLECPNPLPQLWRGWSVFCCVSFAKGSGVFEYCCCRVNAMPVRMFALSNTKIIHTLSHFLFVPSHCIWGSFIGFTNSSTMASCFLLMKRARRGCIVGEISVAPCVDDVVFSTEFGQARSGTLHASMLQIVLKHVGLTPACRPVVFCTYSDGRIWLRVIESVSIWSIPVSWSLKDVKFQTKDCKVDGMTLAEGWYSRLSGRGRGKQSHSAPLWWSVETCQCSEELSQTSELVLWQNVFPLLILAVAPSITVPLSSTFLSVLLRSFPSFPFITFPFSVVLQQPAKELEVLSSRYIKLIQIY